MITLASVSLGACRQNVTIKQDAPGQKAFLTDGQIYDLHSGKIISSSELLADLATAQHLIIGEKHDNAEHHQIELWLIQNLLIQRPQGSVLLEMLTSEQQPRVNQVKCWLKDNPVVRDSRVQELLNWQKGWSWEMYGDIVMQLLRGPYPLLNANIGREQILALYKKNEFPKGKKSTAPVVQEGTVAKLAMRQPFVLFKGLTFQKLCLPGAFRPGDHHNKMLRPGLCVVHASPQYL
nr:ChaN family lipoprotein [Escherichia coli]